MFNRMIEVLSKTGIKRERLPSFRMTAQISAVKDLVKVSHQQLVANLIDRDAYFNSPKKNHTFDAFFYSPNINGVIGISSIGLPDAQEINRLFIHIFYRDEKEKIKQLVNLQTVKAPEAVDKQEALQFSYYLPRQLLQIAEIIRTASPISQETYRLYFEKPKTSAEIKI